MWITVADNTLMESALPEGKHALYAIKKDTLRTFAIQKSKKKTQIKEQ